MPTPLLIFIIFIICVIIRYIIWPDESVYGQKDKKDKAVKNLNNTNSALKDVGNIIKEENKEDKSVIVLDVEKIIQDCFVKELDMNKEDSSILASEIMAKVRDYKQTPLEKRENEISNNIFNSCRVIIDFIDIIRSKDTYDTIFWLGKTDKCQQFNKSINMLCVYEKSEKKYNKYVLETLRLYDIGPRTLLGQFLLHPSIKYKYIQDEIIKSYIKGMKFWIKESKEMSTKEESELHNNVRNAIEFYPFIKNNQEAMNIEIPTCGWRNKYNKKLPITRPGA